MTRCAAAFGGGVSSLLLLATALIASLTVVVPVSSTPCDACGCLVTGKLNRDESSLRQYRVDRCGDYTLADVENIFRVLQKQRDSQLNRQLFSSPNLTSEDIFAMNEGGRFHVAMMLQGDLREPWARLREQKHMDGLQPIRFRALDFGCGLGNYTFAMGRSGVWPQCVDESLNHISAVQDQLQILKGVGGVSPILMAPDLISAINMFMRVTGDEPYSKGVRCLDLVHSHMTLQRFPVVLQVIFLEQICEMLAPGGLIYITTEVSDDGVDDDYDEDGDDAGDDDECDMELLSEKIATGRRNPKFTMTRQEYIYVLARRGCAVEVSEFTAPGTVLITGLKKKK